MKKLRKYASVLTVIISVLVLSACEKTEQKVMYIKPSEFTEETREVLGLFDDEVQFFDIVLDETVKSETMLHIKYTYVHGNILPVFSIICKMPA